MDKNTYRYIIVGGGLAGASGVEGIRQRDQDNEILLISAEEALPYNRPPLTKELWFGKKKIEDIFVHGQKYFDDNKVKLALGSYVVSIDPVKKTVTLTGGENYRYEKLLLATGGILRRLPIPGGNQTGLYYYRYLKDYSRMRIEAMRGKSAVIIGGGFIGSEIAAALSFNNLKVTMIFPYPYICSRIFPGYLGLAMHDYYIKKGIRILKGDKPQSIDKNADKFIVATENNGNIEADIAIVGIGIKPDIQLAEKAGLKIDNGIVINEYLQSSNPDIYAAGDNALFFYERLGKAMRMEHWDNALSQGRQAGKNMAGASLEPFTYLPYFYSDLFDFGYEAIGEIDSSLETFADWQEKNRKGTIYYLKGNRVRGMMMCNVWDKIPMARKIILEGKSVEKDNLRAQK